MADIKFVGDHVEVDGLLQTNGPLTCLGTVTFSGGETKSVGKVAGYSFTDRSSTALFAGASNKPGERFVWYADQGAARLWSGGDMLTITYLNTATGSVQLTLPKGIVEADGVNANVMLLNGVGDLKNVILALQARVKALEDQLKPVVKSGTFPGGGNGRPAPIIK